MRDTYSLDEAKVHLSAIIRRVREGHRVVVTVRGEPVAEIRPIEPAADDIAARLNHLVERRVVVRPEAGAEASRRLARRPGALERFLAERD
ncbi:MAG TPA: type II toxin-antitoxin system prevent-host-death family antitoxin [Gemmatimonadales bacterium]|jgi:prevent-host-death family protein|nr:type II toxin-antitoxin system prevent-host-death family antitoxin [Gemmatimonadales bacterium]